MQPKNILITGGAGFIGSHLTDKLINEGYHVRIFDNLEEQVHGGKKPEYLNPKVEFILGDVTDREALKVAMKGMDVIYHLASAVGVGQSQYQIKHYVDASVGGTANLLDIMVNDDIRPQKMIVAASMSSYGEGLYECNKCGKVRPELRAKEDIESGEWEPKCPNCGARVKAIPTPETEAQYCNSIYALTKKVQEDMMMNIGITYDIPTVALRLFNVYGPRQSLSNPYTGVAAIFSSRIKNDNQPTIFEDGLQSRDFISVFDVADAFYQGMVNPKADYQIFNIGCGTPLSIKGVAEVLAELFEKDIQPEITGKFRKGDVRHCYADMTKAKELLGWEAKVSFADGMRQLAEWGKEEESVDSVDQAIEEMKAKGLV